MSMIEINKFRHFYLNKYLVSPFSADKHFLSYNYQYQFLWFRVAKVASRTMNNYFIEHTEKGKYIYSSETGYLPAMFKDYFKFAFVRNPVDRFISCWKNKVFEQNTFHFDPKTREEMKELKNFIAWAEKLDLDHYDEHLRRQSSLIDMKHIDFVGKIEQFDQDFSHVIQQVGMPVNLVESKNQSKVEIKQEFDPVLIDRIEAMYEKDMLAFYP